MTLFVDKDTQIQQLHEKLEYAERRLAGITADKHAAEIGVVRRYAFASDEVIAGWAKQQPNEQAKKIADLTFRLAREQARVEEMSAANQTLIARLKTKRAAMTEEEFEKAFG